MLICTVVGARPNFMKIAPIVHALHARDLPQILVHTGQHYDANMSQVFFDELALPRPDVFLNVGSDTHARQTARIMVAFEEICQQQQPDLVIVAGDVNSTLAAALVASKLQIAVAHVEAGLRSFDRTMPEEINRILTDQLSDLLFTTEESANKHLLREGVAPANIHFVGNCMVDTLLKHVAVAVDRAPWRDFRLDVGGYALLTLHRPANVDTPAALRPLMQLVNEVSRRVPVVFPVHPRTQARLRDWSIEVEPTVRLVEPLPYLTFLGLMAKARCVLTDSGGIQEETSALRVPCLTLRTNTERPVTVTHGTNRIVGADARLILSCVDEIMAGRWPLGVVPPLWDGQAAVRIADVIENWAATDTPPGVLAAHAQSGQLATRFVQ